MSRTTGFAVEPEWRPRRAWVSRVRCESCPDYVATHALSRGYRARLSRGYGAILRRGYRARLSCAYSAVLSRGNGARRNRGYRARLTRGDGARLGRDYRARLSPGYRATVGRDCSAMPNCDHGPTRSRAYGAGAGTARAGKASGMRLGFSAGSRFMVASALTTLLAGLTEGAAEFILRRTCGAVRCGRVARSRRVMLGEGRRRREVGRRVRS